jgi:hypothetical protein
MRQKMQEVGKLPVKMGKHFLIVSIVVRVGNSISLTLPLDSGMTLLGIPSTSAKLIMLLLLNNFSLILRLVGQSSVLRSFVISFQEGQKVRYSSFACIQVLYAVVVRPHNPFTSLGFAYLEFSVRFGFG